MANKCDLGKRTNFLFLKNTIKGKKTCKKKDLFFLLIRFFCIHFGEPSSKPKFFNDK